MPFGYDYAEGGGRLPPYKESFLENIINVSWQSTGGVFVSGDFCCYQRYTRLEDNKGDEFRWLGLGSQAFGDSGGSESSSYAKTAKGPIFLVGGHGHGHGVLMRSTDGYSWEEVQAGQVMGDAIDRLVWDKKEKLFYASVHNSIRPYYSSDGIYWFYSATFFEEHCRNPLGAPDGIYGYDKSNDLVIYPNEGQAVAIVNASTSDAEEFSLWVGIEEVFAINFTGGIWMAGGGDTNGSVTTTSLDGGNYWFYSSVGDLDMTGNYAVTTMIGAPVQDFRGRYAPKGALPSVKPPAGTVSGAQHASQPKRPQRGVVATAISPSRRPGAGFNGYKWGV